MSHSSRPKNYSGCWQEFWPDGQVKFRGNFVDGTEVGQHVHFFEDGTVARISWLDQHGCPNGTALTFYNDGRKDTEELWDEAEPHPGTFTRRCFDSDGRVFLWTRYREYIQVDYWRRPDDALEEDISAEIDRIVARQIQSLTDKIGDGAT